MTDAEVGLYIRLLCAEWGNGGFSDDDEELSSYGRAMPPTPLRRVKLKFVKGPDGILRNPRMEKIRKKQDDFRTERSQSGSKGSSSRWKKQHGSAIGSAIPKGMANDGSPSPSPTPLSLERERDFPEVNGNPTLPEVLAKATMIGLAPWKAEDWFNEMQGCGWIDHAHRPVREWASILTRVKMKWESDGRPSGPPKGKNANDQKPRSSSPDRNAGTYNEGRAALYRNAAVRGTKPIPDVPNV